ncbi:MAG: helix-turn-helix domain-containing protein [Chthoniobacter sp.]|nr:helix-turn-helix domain-containing protein [Chthoniobacter sp.]
MSKTPRRESAPTIRAIRAQQRAFFLSLEGLGGCHVAFNHLANTRAVIKDKEGRLVWVTDNVPTRHGFASPDAMFGLHDFDFNPRKLAEVYWRDDLQVLRTGEALVGKAEISFNEMGMPDWHVVNKIPLRNRAGQVAGLIATIQPHPGLNRVPLLGGSLRKAAAQIQANLGSPQHLSELAAVAGTSARQLQRNFQAAMGMTPSDFIIRSRLVEACRRLRETDASIGAIALDIGFYDQSAFTKAFRKHIGIKPLEFRRARADHEKSLREGDSGVGSSESGRD